MFDKFIENVKLVVEPTEDFIDPLASPRVDLLTLSRTRAGCSYRIRGGW